jgi:Mrp family chromosome partitioning ATPase
MLRPLIGRLTPLLLLWYFLPPKGRLKLLFTIVLAPAVSGVLMVVKAGETHRELVKQATEALSNVKAPIRGILLNNVKGVLRYYYSHRYAYEYYKPAVESPEERAT